MIRVDESDPVGEVELSFPYRDVVIRRGVDVNDFYDLQGEIGRGKFGTVFRCKEKSSGLTLAAKCVPISRKDERRNVEREVDIMRQLQHPRLIQLYDAFDNGNMMHVILELIEGGELFERVIDDDFILTEKACTVFMRQICEGIDFVHKQNILHLDMKPENILCLTKVGNRIKIIDFGLARKFDPKKKLQVLFGTPEFVAPEVVNFDQIGFPTDMWSVGVICYVLLSGLSPFMGETDVETMANVTIAKYDFDDEAFGEISAEAKDFIQKLLLKDQTERMSAQQCLDHKWLKKKPSAAPPRQPLPLPLLTRTQPIDVPSSPGLNHGLDVTKGNLRTFVERWGDHPNSPYVFDTASHIISPCLQPAVQLSASQCSLKGLSPSPCGSLSTSPESVVEKETAPAGIRFDLEQRRASDSSCILNRADVVSRINLAEEIRKLSDRLFQLTAQQDAPRMHSKTTAALSINGQRTEISTERLEECCSAPWRRTKFRLTSMSREVPNGKAVFSEHFASFEAKPEERLVSAATTTKDMLLHLLDKLDDAAAPDQAPKTAKFKSYSGEWADAESLEQRTISSINTFFQSRASAKKTHPFMATNGIK